MMIDNRLRDNNGDTATSYHQRHFSRFTGFPQYHNTNIDRVCQFLDDSTFQSFLDFQEQDRAYNINYAHGLELDDEFGDPYNIKRNGMDDDLYRFILKCHILAIKCNGTLPNLIQFISAVLGCNEDDVTLGLARHYSKTGSLVGEPDTILIKDINIENVANNQLVPLLASQLQLAVAADKRVLDVNFYTNINTNTFIGLDTDFGLEVKIDFPPYVENDAQINVNSPRMGVTPVGELGITADIPEKVTNTNSNKYNQYIGISTVGSAKVKIGEPGSIVQNTKINSSAKIGVTLIGSSHINI